MIRAALVLLLLLPAVAVAQCPQRPQGTLQRLGYRRPKVVFTAELSRAEAYRHATESVSLPAKCDSHLEERSAKPPVASADHRGEAGGTKASRDRSRVAIDPKGVSAAARRPIVSRLHDDLIHQVGSGAISVMIAEPEPRTPKQILYFAASQLRLIARIIEALADTL